MKKITFILLSIVCLAVATQAQTVIPRIGVSMSTLRANEFVPMLNNDFKGKAGYSLGIGYNLPLTSINKTLVSIQPEFAFVQKGFTLDAEGEVVLMELTYDIKSHQEYTINYLEIPVLTKFEFGSEKFRLGVFIGPAVGFALGGKYKAKSTFQFEDEINTVSSKGKIIFYESDEPDEMTFDHNIDFGAVAGASVTLFNRLVIDARFGTSFTNLNHGEKTKNQAVQLSVGVPIFLQ